MKILSLILFVFLAGCTTIVEKDTYLKYSGYMDGCADTATQLVYAYQPQTQETGINPVWLDTMCMEMYLIKLEAENIKPPMKRFDRNEML